MQTLLFFLFIVGIYVVGALLINMVTTKVDTTWTQKDIDDGDKQYGFMCYTCETPLDDGEGKPRQCDKCKNNGNS